MDCFSSSTSQTPTPSGSPTHPAPLEDTSQPTRGGLFNSRTLRTSKHEGGLARAGFCQVSVLDMPPPSLPHSHTGIRAWWRWLGPRHERCTGPPPGSAKPCADGSATAVHIRARVRAAQTRVTRHQCASQHGNNHRKARSHPRAPPQQRGAHARRRGDARAPSTLQGAVSSSTVGSCHDDDDDDGHASSSMHHHHHRHQHISYPPAIAATWLRSSCARTTLASWS